MSTWLLILIVFIVILLCFLIIVSCVVSCGISSNPEPPDPPDPTYPPVGDLDILNQIISDIGDYPLPPPGYPLEITGTINDFNCSNCSLFDFVGNVGNTTTAGYYANYNCQVNTIKSAFDFTMTQITPISTETNGEQFVTGDFTASFNATINLTGTVNANGEVYIPQTQTCTTACGCCTSCIGNCWSTCACGLDTVTCDCTTSCITWPSTYTSDFLIPITVPITLSISGATLTGTIGYTATNQQSLIPSGNTIADTYVSGYTGGDFYLYQAVLSNFAMAYPSDGLSATLNGSSTTADASEIDAFLVLLLNSLQTSANAYFDITTFFIRS